MKFKMKPVRAAVALALAGASGGAFALGAFDAPQIDVYLAGASAPQNILGVIATGGASGLFSGSQGTDWFVYYDNGTSGTKGASYRAYFGTLKSSAPVPVGIQGKTVLLIDRAKGGSVWGVNPVARNQAIAWMQVSAGNCTSVGAPAGVDYICGETGDDSNPADVNNRIPDFGVSDIEPKMFKEPRNTEWDPVAGEPFHELSASELGNITTFSGYGLLFGQPVTKNVTIGGNVVGDPSVYPAGIPAAIYGGMLAGTIKTWDKVDASLPAEGVMVCRRWPGSGTQASYNQYFHHFPCGVNGKGGNGTINTATNADSLADYFVGGIGSADGTSKANAAGIDGTQTSHYLVVQNSASGDVRTCLKGAKTGTDFFAQDYDGTWYVVQFGGTQPANSATTGPDSLLKTGGATRKAIGILSLDSAPTSDWGFAAVSGVAPTKPNMLSLQYDFIEENTYQYRTSGPNVLGGDKKTYVDLFIQQSGNPAVLSAFTNTALAAAVAATPINYSVSTANVMKGTRSGNACSPIVPVP